MDGGFSLSRWRSFDSLIGLFETEKQRERQYMFPLPSRPRSLTLTLVQKLGFRRHASSDRFWWIINDWLFDRMLDGFGFVSLETATSALTNVCGTTTVALSNDSHGHVLVRAGR